MAAGFVYDRLGEDRKAESHFEQAVKLGGKDNPDVLNNAGAFLCRKGDKKRARSISCRRRRARCTATPEVAYPNAGRCARADGRPKDAERIFPPGARHQAEPRRRRCYSSPTCCTTTGNDLQARAFLQRYHEVAPASASSLWLGYRIERKLGDTAAAGEYARRLRGEFADVDRGGPAVRRGAGGAVSPEPARDAEAAAGPGALLRRAREAAGLSEQQAAEQLNLDVERGRGARA